MAFMERAALLIRLRATSGSLCRASRNSFRVFLSTNDIQKTADRVVRPPTCTWDCASDIISEFGLPVSFAPASAKPTRVEGLILVFFQQK